MPTKITLIFGKFEGYILSGVGSRSVPVGRQAGRPAVRRAVRQKHDLVGTF